MTRAERMTRAEPTPRWHAAIAVIALAAAPNLWAAIASTDTRSSPEMLAWWTLYAAYIVAFAFNTSWAFPRNNSRAIVLLALAQTLAALAANWLVPTVIAGVATGGALLVVAASQLTRIPLPYAIAWVLAQHAALLAIYLDAWPTPIALVAGIAFAVFSFVILSMERMAHRERVLRARLVETLSQLTAARRQLEDQARDAERLRIARDLHDLLGHHLVALSLQLQLAERAEPEESRRAIERASSLTRLLLGDLRAVVSDLREPSHADLVHALQSLAVHDASPRVEVRILADRTPQDPQITQALLRAAQELVTNARKHANASHIRIELDHAELRVRDDGTGGPIAEGFGLRGIRERLEALQGSLEIQSQPGGTLVRVHLPAIPAPAAPETVA